MIKKGFICTGYFFAGCMDFAAGVLIVSILSALFYIEVPLWAYVLGAFLAVLPDMDLMKDLAKVSVKGWDHHRTFMHKPALVIPATAIVGVIVGLLAGNIFFWVSVFVLCVFWHYVHDTKGMGGYGIAWLWPLSVNYWSLRGSERPEDAFTASETWFLDWIHPTPLSVRELSCTVLFLTCAPIFDQMLVEWVTILLPLFCVGVFTVWLTARRVFLHHSKETVL